MDKTLEINVLEQQKRVLYLQEEFQKLFLMKMVSDGKTRQLVIYAYRNVLYRVKTENF